MSRPLARMQAECARILADALTHAAEPGTWADADERMREPDERVVDERHEQRRVDDRSDLTWGRR